jgi:hypothetical protein
VRGALRRLLTLRSLGLDDALRLRHGNAFIVQLAILRRGMAMVDLGWCFLLG